VETGESLAECTNTRQLRLDYSFIVTNCSLSSSTDPQYLMGLDKPLSEAEDGFAAALVLQC
jgi:hypothetical protein